MLQEIFNFKIEENHSELNDLIIGAVDGEINWGDLNTVFGNFILLLKYLILKNKVSLNEVELEYQGVRSYFKGISENNIE